MRRRYRQAIGVGLTAALALTPIVGDEIIGVTLMAADTTSAERDRRRTGDAPSQATPKWVGALVIGMVGILALQVIGLRGFVQH